MRFLSILLICLLLLSCQKSPYNKIPQSGTILAFGDSLTYGYNVESKHSYPAVLEILSERTVVNAGVSGEVTVDGLKRLSQLLGENQYDFLILLEGGNDILKNYPTQQIKENLAKMIDLAQQHNIPVLLIAVPEKSLMARPSPIYKELSEIYNVPSMNKLISRLLKQAKYKSDTVHFNEDGYRRLAKEIYKTMQKLGAL